jgi:phosphinothricin acetyltransferase
MMSGSTSAIGAVTIRLADAADAAAVAAIYNQGIEERTATFETELRTPEDVARRIGNDPQRFPVLVAGERDSVLGWASIGPYRDRRCYAGIGEFSVYVHRDARGRGVGRALLTRLIVEATARGYWKLLSRIFPFNSASLTLCRSLGFREVGTYEKHGCLDGRWLDVVIVERLISETRP